MPRPLPPAPRSPRCSPTTPAAGRCPSAPVAVDRQYVRAAAGLLAAEAPVAAATLATSLVSA
jgi:hypothetical protein